MRLGVKERWSIIMQLTRDFISYMAKETLRRLTAADMIVYEQPEYVTEVMTQVMLDELTIEDRIDDEVRKILEQNDAKMKETGAEYEEMFKKVKRQLVRDRKVVI
jgi:hypothetical protein